MGETVYALQFTNNETGEDVNRIIGVYSSKINAQIAAEARVVCKINWQCNGTEYVGFPKLEKFSQYRFQITACEVM